jgi:hypothetical protein
MDEDEDGEDGVEEEGLAGEPRELLVGGWGPAPGPSAAVVVR